MVHGLMEHSLKVRGKLFSLKTVTAKKREHHCVALINLNVAHLMLANTTEAHLPKLPALRRAQNRSRQLCKRSCPQDLTTQEILLLEIPVVRKLSCSLWQISRKKKIIPQIHRFLEQNYAICVALLKYKSMSPACYGDLVEMKCLNMGHKGSTVSRAPITKHL